MNLLRFCQFPTDFGDVFGKYHIFPMLEGTHGVRGQECRLVVGGPAGDEVEDSRCWTVEPAEM